MEIVYKFRNWTVENHRKTLCDNQIFFTSPPKLNDPFDCHIPENFILLNCIERKRYINDQIEFLKQQGESDIENIVRNAFANTEELQKKHDDHNYKFQSSCIGVFSCGKCWNNILMWSHYANDHKGFCVGFNLKKLQQYNFALMGVFRKVKYKHKLPRIKPLVPNSINKKKVYENYIVEVTTKAIDWKYEKEYRFVKINPNGLDFENRKIYLSNDCIAEVVLGLSISECDEDQITKICRDKNISLYKVIRVLNSFSIDRIQIL